MVGSGSMIARYTRVAMVLHWLVACVIGANLVLIWFVDDWPKDWVRPVIDLHKSFGITVLGLVLMRLLWRASGTSPHPCPPPIQPGNGTPRRWRTPFSICSSSQFPCRDGMHDSAWKDGPTHPVKLFWLIPWPRIAMIANVAQPMKEHLHDIFLAAHRWFALCPLRSFRPARRRGAQAPMDRPGTEIQRMLP